MILIDTSVLVDYFRKKEKTKTLFYRITGVRSDLAISAITHYEIFVGTKPEQDSFWQNLFKAIILMPFGKEEADEAVAIQKELLRKNKMIGFGDIAIGATARFNKFEISTLNRKDFERIEGLKFFDIPE
ncbi:MAG: type II toxin-antitoxin system VapC family toxin [Bacteroidota bacterium]